MSESKNAALIQRLHARTKEGKILWERTIDEGVFRATVGATSVSLVPDKTPDGWGNYVDTTLLRIFNDEGSVIEEISSDSVGKREFADLLQELYELARRQAMGVDQILDKLLDQLNGQ